MHRLRFLVNDIKSKVDIDDFKSDTPCGKYRVIDCFEFFGHVGKLADFLIDFVKRVSGGLRIQQRELNVVSSLSQVLLSLAGDVYLIISSFIFCASTLYPPWHQKKGGCCLWQCHQALP